MTDTNQANQQKTIQVLVNDRTTEVPSCSIACLLEDLGIKGRAVAVEVNEVLVPQSEHCSHRLESGDRLEIVTLAGGG